MLTPEDIRRTTDNVAQDIAEQRVANHSKWGAMSIENRIPEYPGWLPTLVEEVGEVARAMQMIDWGDRKALMRIRAEAMDTAAVAMMLIDSIDRSLRN